MTEVDINFSKRVNELVAQIPNGRVMTYGQLAALSGSPLAARIVGGIAHYGSPDLPWQRVVNKSGGLASGFPGGPSIQKAMLEAEGITFDRQDKLDIDSLIWWPEESGK